MRIWHRFAALACLTLPTTLATAQEVRLGTDDGSVAVAGTLVSFDGTTYVLDTVVGQLSFEADLVSCFGDACPFIAPPPSDLAVLHDPDLSAEMLATLLAGYADTLGATVIPDADSTDAPRYALADAEGEDLAYVTLRPADTSSGMVARLADDSAMVIAGRPADPDEIAALAETGPARAEILALDGLVIVTAPDNPLDGISLADAARVFSGEAANWSDLGGPDAPVTLYARDGASGTGRAFADMVLTPAQVTLSDSAQFAASDVELVDLVAADPDGIGVVGFAATQGVRALPLIEPCGIVAAASEFTIRSEEYPLTRRYHAHIRAAEEDPHLLGFLAHLQTPGAQAAMAGTGLVSQDISTGRAEDQGLRFASAIQAGNTVDDLRRLQEMVAAMVPGRLLSAAFRFETGSSALDARARHDVVRAAAYLGGRPDATARLIGFTDSVGDANLNRELASRRAEQVQAALVAEEPTLADRITFETHGYGGLSPLACNETATGRWINRRVELWIEEP
ncbi:MAG: phosphate ABC transporter substrate-binding/OmpA family protein [Pseudomonadota bacterium]